ncbi:hypothetical protein HPB51_004414 [Rhipicephalus microplus]|uniref:Very-long-chain (3R)-3-hydroxyacyl-CoA dehydratase n=1 Tax=Rhipicephalus microplus TaxID=6941 RepID=A0A9J6EM34_RHIMP|nr:hypothetical protein HPB51_004414 [Rhipicephalus microplus]
MNVFQEWLSEHEEVYAAFLTDDIKRLALLAVLKQTNPFLIALVCDVYKLEENGMKYTDIVQDLLLRKRFSEASTVVASLKLHGYFTLEDIPIPIFLMDKMTLLESYLEGQPELQKELLIFLDNLYYDGNLADGVISKLNGKMINRDQNNPKTLEKIISRLLKQYGLPEDAQVVLQVAPAAKPSRWLSGAVAAGTAGWFEAERQFIVVRQLSRDCCAADLRLITLAKKKKWLGLQRRAVLRSPKRGPGEAGKLYLAAYNFLQCAGWGYILFCTLQYLMHKRTFKGLWPVVACPTEIFQTLALLEVVHCLVGLVSSNAFLTLIQILSRLMVVWGILVPVPECQDQFGIVMLLVAWCLAEITRYAVLRHHAVQLLPIPAVLVQGEIVTMVAALPYIRKRGLFTYPLPNHLNFSFDYYIFVILVIGSYLPFFPQLFGHLLKQRKRFLSPSDDSKRK